MWKCQFSILTKENPNLLEWLLSVSGQPVLLLLLLLLLLFLICTGVFCPGNNDIFYFYSDPFPRP